MLICNNCQSENNNLNRFCNSCGSKLIIEPQENYESSIKKTNIIFLTLLAYVALIHIIKFENNYIYHLLNDVVFSIIVISLYFFRGKSIKLNIVSNQLKLKIIFLIISGSIAFAFVVNILVSYLNNTILNGNQISYLEPYLNSPAPLTLTIISTAVFPAVFEELAFRGILFDELKKLTTIKATIAITSILFTILHFSALGFLWIMPVGILYGYLRAKYNHLTYGIIGHLVYNSTIVLIEYFEIFI